MKKVLIVDDDNELRRSLSDLLSLSGYHTSDASSGKAAIERMNSEDFDVILLDVMMPQFSGIDALAELKRLSPRTPIVMITAYPTMDCAITAMKKGARDYISKPFKKEDLLSKIGRVIKEAEFCECSNPHDLDCVLNSISNPLRRKIMKSIFSGGSLKLAEIAKELDIDDHSKVVFHLKSLKEGGVIDQNKDKAYFVTEAGEKVLECLKIIEKYLSNKPLKNSR